MNLSDMDAVDKWIAEQDEALKSMSDLELLLQFVASVSAGSVESVLAIGSPYGDSVDAAGQRDKEVAASVADYRDNVIPDEHGEAWEILKRMRR